MDRLSILLIILTSVSSWDYFVVYRQKEIYLRGIMVYKIFRSTLHFQR